MRKVLALFLAGLMFFPHYVFAGLTRNIQDNTEAAYVCLNSTGAPVSGQTINLTIKKTSTGNWFDFSDSTFKSSGWTTKEQTLTYNSTDAIYTYNWNPPSSESAAEQYLFVYDNANTTYRDHQIESVEYQNIGTSTYAGGAVASVTAAVTVGTNNDKTGYSLAQTFPANFSALSISATGAINDVTTVNGLAGNVITANAIAGDAITASKIQIGAIGASELATDAATEIATATWAIATRQLTGTQEFNLTGNITGNIAGNLSGSVGSVIALSAAAIQSIWDALTSALTTVSSVGKLLVDNINAAIGSRMATFTLPGNFSALSITSGGNVTSSNAGSGATAQEVWEYGNRTLTSAGAGGATAQEVWSYGNRTLTAGTNIILAKGTGITGFNDIAAADVWSVGTRTITGGTVTTNSDKTGYSLSQSFPGNFSNLLITSGGAVTVGTNNDKTGYGLSSAAIDGIWQEDVSGYTTPGQAGTYQVTGGAGGGLNATEVADAVWDAQKTDYVTAGTFGYLLDSRISTISIDNATIEFDPDIIAAAVWSTSVATGYTGLAGEYMRKIYQATDGEQESGNYTGIEKMIRIQR